MTRLEFFFDCSSPWTYIAFHNAQPMARDLGIQVEWRPFLVGGVFNTINPSVYEFRQKPVPAKDRYIGKDMQDWARAAGLTVRWRPSVFPVNSVKIMRGCLVAARSQRLVEFATAAFEAYWRDDLDLSQDATVREVCKRSGLDTESLLREIADPRIKEALRSNTDELIARGGFGSPTMFVDGDDMYFGNDRLELVRSALKKSLENRVSPP
jgi:2-hydroxychromene-2-carboxylate isomerase